MSKVPSKKILELRFPEFTGEWVEIFFGDIYEFKSTNSYSRDMLSYESGSIKNIHYGDIHTKFKALFCIEKENVPFIDPSIDLSKLKEDQYLQEGDLVIADASEDYADIGKSIEVVSLGNTKAVAGLHTLLARKKKNVELASGFSIYLMRSRAVRHQIMRVAQGTKVLGLSSNLLGQVKMKLPMPVEQKKITALLSAVDRRIEGLEKKRDLLKEYKKGLMQQLFSQTLRFTDDRGKFFPNWEEKRLGEGAEINPNTGKLPKRFIYIDLESVVSGVLVKAHVLENDSAPSRAQRVLTKNDILFQMVRPYQKNNFFFDLEGDFVASTGYAQLRTMQNPKYLYYHLHYEPFVLEVISKCTGTGYPAINSTDLAGITVSFPSLAEQDKIADCLSAVDRKIEAVEAQVSWTRVFKQGLLKKMFV